MIKTIAILFLIYLFLINFITYFTYAADKTKACQHKWRIPERIFVLLAILGGSPAALLATENLQPQNPPPEIQTGSPPDPNRAINSACATVYEKRILLTTSVTNICFSSIVAPWEAVDFISICKLSHPHFPPSPPHTSLGNL